MGFFTEDVSGIKPFEQRNDSLKMSSSIVNSEITEINVDTTPEAIQI